MLPTCGHCVAGVNAAAFWGRTLMDGVLAILLTIWAFKLVPTFLFCQSLDPCSCTSSAGFDILSAFCNVTSEPLVGNASSSFAANTTNDLKARAQGEFTGVFDSLGGNAVTIIVGVAALVLVVIFFLVADLFLELIKIGDEKAEIEQRAKELLEKNLEIRKQVELEGECQSKVRAPTSLIAREFGTHRFVMFSHVPFIAALLPMYHVRVTGMNKKQVKVVEDNSDAITTLVSPAFKLDWKKLTFVRRLGSGTFGDCFEGSKAGRPVAIKKMRAGEFRRESRMRCSRRP